MSTTQWKEVELGDLVEVKHGFAFLGEYFGDVGKHILLTPGNFLEAGGFQDKTGDEKFYDGPVEADYVLNAGDLVIAMTEQTDGLLGSSALIPKGGPYLHNQRIGRVLVRDSAKADKRFIYYLFNTREVRHQISASATGTKIRHTAPNRVAAVHVRVPDIGTQRRIAETLSSYDDLIVNSRRRVALLMEAIQLVFSEWFVNSRAPDRVTGIDGDLPAGWRAATAADAMRVLSGGTPRTETEAFWNGQIPFFTPNDAVREPYVLDTELHITEDGLASSNSKLFPKDTIFITARGTVGEINLAQRPMAMNQSCYALAALEPLTQRFLFCALGQTIRHLRQHAGGAVFDAVIVDTFSRIPFTIPDRAAVEEFDRTVAPMFAQVENLLLRVQRLRSMRDLLLPRLTAGETQV